MLKRLSTLLAFLIAGSAHGLATIGSTTDCTFNNILGNPIQSAINAGHTDIRLVGGLNYNGRVTVAGTLDVQIRGGYASCAGAALGQRPTVPTRSNVNAGGNLAEGLFIEPAPNRRRVVTFELIDLRPPAGIPTTGTGIVAPGVIDVVLLRSKISGYRFIDQADGQGGGLRLSGARLYASRSEISDNHAKRGGGIYCQQGGSVELDPATLLLSNRAFVVVADGGHGGGIYAQGCTIRASGRTLPIELGGSNGIIGNGADLSGGGIFAIGGTVRISGGPYCYGPDPTNCLPRLAVVALNQAKYGGGIALTDSATLEIDYGNVSLNQATVSGGAIDAVNSSVRVGGLASIWPDYDRSHCPEGICEQINQNTAGSLGGAIYSGGTPLFIVDALLDANRSPTGAAIYSNESQSVLQQVLIRNINDGATNVASVIRSLQGILTVKRSTIAVESPNTAAGRDTPTGNQIERILDLSGTDTQLERSMIADASGTAVPVQLAAGAILTGTCNAHLGNNIAAALSLISTPVTLSDFASDGLYTPTANGDLIDRCTNDGLNANAVDILGMPRSVLQAPANLLHPVDIGAIERVGLEVFQDGFE